MISTFTSFTQCFFSSNPACFRLEIWMNDDICLLISLRSFILSKISSISISSRKRSHIPPWENRKIIDSRVPAGRGYAQTLPSFRQLDLPYSLSSPWPGPGLWTSPALPTSRRVSQCWHSLPAASGWRSQRKNPSLGWMVRCFSSCFQDISGRVQMRSFALDISAIQIFVSNTLNLYKIPMISHFEEPSNSAQKRIPFQPTDFSVCLSRCKGCVAGSNCISS